MKKLFLMLMLIVSIGIASSAVAFSKPISVTVFDFDMNRIQGAYVYTDGPPFSGAYTNSLGNAVLNGVDGNIFWVAYLGYTTVSEDIRSGVSHYTVIMDFWDESYYMIPMSGDEVYSLIKKSRMSLEGLLNVIGAEKKQLVNNQK